MKNLLKLEELVQFAAAVLVFSTLGFEWYWFLHLPLAELAGAILFAHSSLDRILGYGLKHFDSFRNTHLGTIGK